MKKQANTIHKGKDEPSVAPESVYPR